MIEAIEVEGLGAVAVGTDGHGHVPPPQKRCQHRVGMQAGLLSRVEEGIPSPSITVR